MSQLFKSPVLAVAVYIVTIIVIGIYLVFKYNHKRLFTIYNVSIYIMFFSYVIVTPFFFNNLAWLALGQTRAEPFYPYLYESISINFIGLLIFLLSDMYFEKRNEDKVVGQKISRILENNISYHAVCAVLIIISVVYLFIVFKFNGGLPLFNGGRAFFYDSGLVSYIYQASTTMISLSGLYIGLYWVNNKKGIWLFIWAVLLYLSTGSRSDVFLGVIYPVIIALIIKNHKRVKIKYIVLPAVILFVFGIYVGAIRAGANSSVNYINQILYGNNFSDIRDGAFMFYGYENNFNAKIVFGKTYLAGLLSFVPSSMSNFRQEWSFGRFSTFTLFGMKNHFGLRGGIAFEPYINFRIIGVILGSILSGYLFANVEKSYTLNFYNKNRSDEKMNVNSIFFAKLLVSVQSFFSISTNIRVVYELIVYWIMILFIKTMLSANKPKAKYY